MRVSQKRFEQSAELADRLAQREERLKFFQTCMEESRTTPKAEFFDGAIAHAQAITAQCRKAVEADSLARKLLPRARVRAKMRSDRKTALQQGSDPDVSPKVRYSFVNVQTNKRHTPECT